MKPTIRFPCPARVVALLLPLLFATGVFGQTTIVTETFDTDGEGTRYTSSAFDDGGEDFFERVTANPDSRHNAGFFSGFLFSPPQSDAYWASEDVNDGMPSNPLGNHAIVRLNDVDASGFNNLQVSVFLAQTADRFDIADKIEIQYAFDVDSGGTNLTAGTYTTIGRFIGSGPTIFDDGAMQQDTDLNGVPDGAILSTTMTEYTFFIPAVGTNLSVQIRIEQNGGSEELAFDHIQITGVPAVSDPPVLANIEPGALSYAEGDPATQVTNTITVSDIDSTTLSSASVQISGNHVPSEDVLAVSGSLPVGLSAFFNTATGTLSIVGTASLADYQSALRAVTYQNFNSANPSTATRTITFQVDDGTNNSNTQSRSVQIAGFIASATIPHLENLDTDGEGVRYTSSTYNAGGGDFFERTDANPHPDHSGLVTFSAPQGSGFWASEDIDSAGNPLGDHGILRLQDLDATGLSNLEVRVYLAEIAPTGEGPTDKIEIQYAFDGDSGGTDLAAGSYTTIGRFVPNSPDIFTTGAMTLDSDLDGVTHGDPEDAFSPTLTPTLTEYFFDIPATGNLLSVQIRVQQNGGGEELAFDHIQITGVPAVSDPPVLANIEPGALSYTEGDPAAQVTNTITVSDSDSTTLISASVQISGNYVPSEDVLAVSGGLPGGLLASFDFATGTLSISGTAFLADYQSALRAVTYENTDAANPSTATRTIRFQVNDGTVFSNFVTRDIAVTQQPIAAGALPYTEDFETDGDGVRYSTNAFNTGALESFFERVETNPDPRHNAVGFSAFTFTPPQGGAYFASEDVANAANSLGDHGIVRLRDLDVTGATGMQVSVFLAQTADRFDLQDKIEIQYALDADRGGADLSAGTYTTIGRFVANSPDIFTPGPMTLDSDLDGVTHGDPDDAASPTLDTIMTEYVFDIPATGNLLSVQIRLQQNGGNEELAFDHIRVTAEGPIACDVDGNGAVDINDIRAILAARNQPAVPGDPGDADGDGVITVLDARQCVLQCTNPRCAP